MDHATIAGSRAVFEAREMRIPQGDSKVLGIEYMKKRDLDG
jgi:hypothetical protein